VLAIFFAAVAFPGYSRGEHSERGSNRIIKFPDRAAPRAAVIVRSLKYKYPIIVLC
jgi:hypothetical protein